MSNTSALRSLAECSTHNLKVSAVTLASDPVSNISLLSGLQSTLESTEAGRHQLQTLAAYIAGVMPSAVVCHNDTKVRLNRDTLNAMVANAHDNQHSSHHESAEKSRVELAVLLLGVWADKLPARLASAHAKVPEAAEGADRSFDQVLTNEASAVPALINALPTAAAAEAFTTAFSSGAPASGSASESASMSINHDGMSPRSAITVAASQPLPCSADHMSMMVSDLEEEEEDKQQEWDPDFFATLCLCFAVLHYAALRSAVSCYAMPCFATPCYAMLCYAMLCYAMPRYVLLCCPRPAMLCHAVPCCPLPCYAMLCCAMQCWTCHSSLCMTSFHLANLFGAPNHD